MKFDKQGLLALFIPRVVPVKFTVNPGEEVTLYIKELSAAKVFELQQRKETSKDKADSGKEFSLMLLQETLVDEEGKPAFSDEEVRGLMQSKISVFQRLVEIAAQTSGITQGEKKGNA